VWQLSVGWLEPSWREDLPAVLPAEQAWLALPVLLGVQLRFAVQAPRPVGSIAPTVREKPFPAGQEKI
jgi:hypothetical protein